MDGNGFGGNDTPALQAVGAKSGFPQMTAALPSSPECTVRGAP